MRLLIAFVGAITVVVSSVSFNETEISEEIESAFQCHNNPGLAVSVVKDGKILLSRGFGVIDLINKTPVTSSTLFGIASLSKSFAATLLVKLLHENTNLTVDSRIRELLGDQFQMPDSFRTYETTFADAMSHRTGIPPNNYIRYDTRLTRESLIKRLHLLQSPKQFRVKYYYSNIIYGLVTWLAEVIGGESWENLVTKNLFEPLEMNSSTFASVVDFDRPDVAVGYEKRNGTYTKVSPEFSKRWSQLAGSGSLISNADDMTKWMNFHLYKGQNLKGQQIMSSEILAEVHKSRFVVPISSDKEIRVPTFPITSSGEIYAHGFVRGFYRGYEHMSHSGSTQGYRAYISLLPQQKIGVFMALTGEDNRFIYRLPQIMYLLDRALGIEPWLNVTSICTYPEPWTAKPRPSSSPVFDANTTFQYAFQQYEGTYYNNAYGHLQVSYNDTFSTLTVMYGWGKWQLLRLALQIGDGMERFYGKAMEITQLNINLVDFITKVQDGNIIIAKVKLTSSDIETPPIFDKVDINVNSKNDATNNHIHVYIMSVLLILLFVNL